MEASILNLAPYLVGLTGAGLALFLFLEMKRMQQDFQVRWSKRQQAIQSELGALRGVVQDLKARVDDAERRAEALVPPQSPPSGFNLSRRTQAIRLFRRGERLEQIAATLCLPQKEVELLLKVQQILTGSMDEEAGARRQEAMEGAR
ncbi:MAG: hypothetical protein IANPNBLG_03945 [Bryobacteraceae bacterium]|nr:hypothetical protein [Bryobacteraceae bacterium]